MGTTLAYSEGRRWVCVPVKTLKLILSETQQQWLVVAPKDSYYTSFLPNGKVISNPKRGPAHLYFISSATKAPSLVSSGHPRYSLSNVMDLREKEEAVDYA